MARVATVKWNDSGNDNGVCVSVYMQGCRFHCEGCHNQSTWDFGGGEEISPSLISQIIKGLDASGVRRNLNILGGEPLAKENRLWVATLIASVNEVRPKTKITVWTGYTMEELGELNNPLIFSILEGCDCLVDGRFILSRRNLKLPMRGSDNQRIWKKGEHGEWLIVS